MFRNKYIRLGFKFSILIVATLSFYGLYSVLDPIEVSRDRTRYVLIALATGLLMFVPLEKYTFRKNNKN